jgi:hypothetical protein
LGGITAVACFTVVAVIPDVACVPAVVGGLDIAVILKRPGSLNFFLSIEK